MGKTGRWFRSLLSSKKSPAESSYPQTAAAAAAAEEEEEKKKKKSKWAFSKSNDNKLKNGEYPLANPYAEGMDANKHAIAVAAATAVVAEAALAAAKAAAEVVRLTSGGTSGRNVRLYIGGDRRRVAAAVKIQSAFRAYLARRALRALKGLVKLQALVRGNIVRKQSAEMLRRMQAMARIQARASAHRSYLPELSNLRHPGLANQRNYRQRLNNTIRRSSMQKNYNSRSHTSSSISKEEASNWLDHWMEQKSTFNHRHDDEKNDKILEIDTWKPRRHITSRRADRTFPTSLSFSSHDETTAHEYSKIGSLSRLSGKLKKPINPSISSESSPRVRSAIALPTNDLREAVTPAISECSRSLFGDYYLGHPNYMANTESSRAKVRSQSVPKQRILLEEQRLSTSWCT